MKISELIERLNAHMYVYGDLDVLMPQVGDGEDNPILWNAMIEVVQMEFDKRSNKNVVVIY